MSRRDKRKNEAPMSFFSFQDIVSCVAGILVMITLLMAIELAKRPQTLGRNAKASAPDWVSLAEELRTAQKIRDDLTNSLERAQATLTSGAQRLTLTAAILDDLRNRVAALRKNLNEYIGNRERGQLEQDRMAEQVAQAQTTRGVLAEKVRQLDQQLALESTKTRVTLLGGNSAGKKPFLVELGVKQVSVVEILSSGETRQVKDLVAGDAVPQFLQWARTRSSDAEYFVLLVRPEAAGLVTHVIGNLKQAGFDLGWDVWPVERSLLGQARGG